MKKNIKKLTSMMLALVMAFALAAPAFAAEAPAATTGSVTVSITQGMFTPGGMGDDGKTIPQEFCGGALVGNKNFPGIVNYNVSIDTIKAMINDGIQDVYEAPEELPANVLDAIITAFYQNNYKQISAGWDDNPEEGEPGGYINNVEPQEITYGETVQKDVNGKLYNVYSGTGWNIAVSDENGSIKAITEYGSSIELKPGMQIVFDISAYSIYDLATKNS